MKIYNLFFNLIENKMMMEMDDNYVPVEKELKDSESKQKKTFV